MQPEARGWAAGLEALPVVADRDAPGAVGCAVRIELDHLAVLEAGVDDGVRHELRGQQEEIGPVDAERQLAERAARPGGRVDIGGELQPQAPGVGGSLVDRHVVWIPAAGQGDTGFWCPLGDTGYPVRSRRPARRPAVRPQESSDVGELGAFLKITRVTPPERDPRERVADYKEIYQVLPEEEAARQGARCMECGVPFCHDGCPLGNLIPDWNDLVYRGRWREAIEQLHATNDFPEWTGLICPAPCEPACVLAINDDPVSIKQIELAIVERAWEEGWIVPRPPETRTGRSVAVVGSGPAGLAAAAHLNRAGHDVVVYERDEGAGGLLRFGVPDFKLEKWYIDRRVTLMEAEGVRFSYGVEIGSDITAEELSARHDAVVLAIGSRVHRLLDVPGADLQGVRFAMDYLYARNRWVARGDAPGDDPELTAAGKHVVVIGGGDTAMDCVGNAHREHAASVTVLDTYPAPPGPAARDSVPWPEAPAPARQHVRARRGRRAPLDPDRDAARRPRRPRRRRARQLRHAAARPAAGARHRVRAAGRPRARGDRLLAPGARRLGRAVRARARPARQRQGADVRDVAPGGVRRGRRPHRSVAGRERDRRGATLRSRGGSPPRRCASFLTIYFCRFADRSVGAFDDVREHL